MRKRNEKQKEIVKIKLTQKSAEELADLGIELGLEDKIDRERLIKYYLQEKECIFG